MVNKLKRIGIILSIIFNIAFIGGYCYKSFWSKPETTDSIKPRVRQLFKKLNLSDEQKEKLRQSMDSVLNEVSKIRGQIRTHRLEMTELLTAPTTDREAIEAKRKEIARLQQEIQKLVLDRIIENKDVLTSEQQRKLFAYLKVRIKRTVRGGD